MAIIPPAGRSLVSQGKLTEASDIYRHALALGPEHVRTLRNYANALSIQGMQIETLEHHHAALKIAPEDPIIRSDMLLMMNYLPNETPDSLYRAHQEWGQVHGHRPVPAMEHVNARDPQRPLRIGYVSPDLADHSVAHFMSQPLNHHDRERYPAYCYADVTAADDTTHCLASAASHWRFISGQSDEEVAKTIREDQIDILIDLAGHTGGNRLTLFALKPAPIQLTYLALPKHYRPGQH